MCQRLSESTGSVFVGLKVRSVRVVESVVLILVGRSLVWGHLSGRAMITMIPKLQTWLAARAVVWSLGSWMAPLLGLPSPLSWTMWAQRSLSLSEEKVQCPGEQCKCIVSIEHALSRSKKEQWQGRHASGTMVMIYLQTWISTCCLNHIEQEVRRLEGERG